MVGFLGLGVLDIAVLWCIGHMSKVGREESFALKVSGTIISAFHFPLSHSFQQTLAMGSLSIDLIQRGLRVEE